MKSSTQIRIDPVAPGLYSANASGQGVAAGLWIRESPDGAQTWGYLFDPAKPAGNRVAVPVDLGAGGELYISLYGTGLRHASKASATIGGVAVPVYGFAPTSEYQGEDIVNIGPLPKSLAGRGELEVVVTFDDKTANVVTANFQ